LVGRPADVWASRPVYARHLYRSLSLTRTWQQRCSDPLSRMRSPPLHWLGDLAAAIVTFANAVFNASESPIMQVIYDHIEEHNGGSRRGTVDRPGAGPQ